MLEATKPASPAPTADIAAVLESVPDLRPALETYSDAEWPSSLTSSTLRPLQAARTSRRSCAYRA
jgi:hypothetical protein